MSEVQTDNKAAKQMVEDGNLIRNDLSMIVATVNGSGSQTSNMAIIRSLFRMGIPVTGKNLFPSNIQGLPTWFTIRASEAGYMARREKVEILVAMNQATFGEDLLGLADGGVCFYDDRFTIPVERGDLVFYPMPVRDLVREVAPPRALRDYIANMAYVGVVAQILGIEMQEIRFALETHFQGKTGPVEMNMSMVDAAAAWAKENLTKEDPYILRRSDQTSNSILIDGNTAAALGAIYGGVSFIAWYPITPASSLPDAVQSYLPELRRDEETGKFTYAIIQAEDELSAVGMTVGAGWAGARAMTATSGPGISLMAEFAGLAFFAEIPVVIWDVQRMGPSTGLPTRTSQGDILFVRFLGHGDTNQIILLPSDPNECFTFGWQAFDLADRLQTPIFLLSDLDLGMNLWMSDPFTYPDQPMDRGKVLHEEDIERLGEFARYRDVDGDGIPYRTLPGNQDPRSAWFVRGTGHDERAFYSERGEDWTANMDRLWRKLDTAKQYLPKPVVDQAHDTSIGIIAYGSTDPTIREARDRLEESGISANYLRLRALPFHDEIADFIEAHERIYVVEMNYQGQMHKLLQMEWPHLATRLQSLCINDGLPMTARWLTNALRESEQVEEG